MFTRGDRALVTGASSGIGEAFARRLAADGLNLLLVARRESRLQALQTELEQQHGVQVTVLTADLSTDEGIGRVEAAIRAHPDLALLVNNAGLNHIGDFAGLPLARHQEMVTVMVEAVMRLMHAALPAMIAARRGAILNVESMNAMLLFPTTVTYGACKAMLLSLSQGVALETWQYGLHVSALCPGFTRTEIFATEGFAPMRRFVESFPAFMWSTSEEVVSAGLAGLARRKPIIVPGFLNKLGIALSRLPGVPALTALILRTLYPRLHGRILQS